MDKETLKFMSMLMEKCTVKPSRIGDPNIYLYTDIGNLDNGNESYAWTMSSDYYVKEYIRNVKKPMKDKKIDFNKNTYDIN